jgi:glutathionylspermidine synthase
MQRHTIEPRYQWQKKVKEIGFTYFNDAADGVYWREDAYYELTNDEVENMYSATKELFQMCMEAVDYIIKNDLFKQFTIHPKLAQQIIDSWNRDDPTLYGRYDLTLGKDGKYKMLEFNADTPTSLFEASIVQWDWAKSIFPKGTYDQYNSIHETMIEQFKYIKKRLPVFSKLYFTSVLDLPEDAVTTFYIKSLAEEAGLSTEYIGINNIGYDGKHFVDMHNKVISHIFKLYPWEWLVNEEFGQHAFTSMKTWIEPVWKMLLSNKAILPVLWKMYPNHPNLLPAFFENEYDGSLKYTVKKPILSREGNNIDYTDSSGEFKTDGHYQAMPMIIQETCTLPKFDGNYAVFGAWVVGDEPCGLGIREDANVITKNTSKFVPHIFR